MGKKSCSHFKNFIAKKMTKDMVIMISIIIHNYSNKEIIYKGEILRKKGNKK
jgi:hypothetical protein